MYHRNGFVTTYGHKNQTSNKCYTARSASISQKQDGLNIYVIMKTMCLPGYHQNSFKATHSLGRMMYGYTFLVPMN